MICYFNLARRNLEERQTLKEGHFVGAALAGIFALPLLLSPASAALDGGFQIMSVNTDEPTITATAGMDLGKDDPSVPQLNCSGSIVSLTDEFMELSNSNYAATSSGWINKVYDITYDANGHAGLVEFDSNYNMVGPGSIDSDRTMLHLVVSEGSSAGFYPCADSTDPGENA